MAVDASGKFKNTKDTSKTIHYKLMNGDKEFKSASYTENSDNTMLTLLIDKSDWDKAYAGTYTDTLVFTISYR